jgi:hypothetical protein
MLRGAAVICAGVLVIGVSLFVAQSMQPKKLLPTFPANHYPEFGANYRDQ